MGKTLSARHYSRWDVTRGYLTRGQQSAPGSFRLPPAGLDAVRTVFWTAPVLLSARRIIEELTSWCYALDTAIRLMPNVGWRPQPRGTFPHVELVIVDEADRLKTSGPEQVRDLYDRHRIGVVLIGMPGLQRRLTRYPQLYSRVGFAHEYRPLGQRELLDVLAGHADGLGLKLPAGSLEDPDALAAIVRITGGNFRLVQRLFVQINRIAEINNPTTLTRDVVETARESLIIGTA